MHINHVKKVHGRPFFRPLKNYLHVMMFHIIAKPENTKFEKWRNVESHFL